MKKQQKSKSPIHKPTLRLPGQRLHEEATELAVEGVLLPMVYAIAAVAFALREWIDYLSPRVATPWTLSAIGATVCSWATWKVIKNVRRLRLLTVGRQGEIAVGQYLERFRGEFAIFHDVPTGEANIDHVLIGRKGVFTIETKTLSKPVKGPCTIRMVDGRLAANGMALDRDPIRQAKAQQAWLGAFFGEVNARPPIQPVVAFPGWFIESFDHRAHGVWVVEPKALDKFLSNAPEKLSEEQVKGLALGLSSYIRSRADV